MITLLDCAERGVSDFVGERIRNNKKGGMVASTAKAPSTMLSLACRSSTVLATFGAARSKLTAFGNRTAHHGVCSCIHEDSVSRQYWQLEPLKDVAEQRRVKGSQMAIVVHCRILTGAGAVMAGTFGSFMQARGNAKGGGVAGVG